MLNCGSSVSDTLFFFYVFVVLLCDVAGQSMHFNCCCSLGF